MKTKIISNQNGSVTVSRNDAFTGERYERTYFTGKSEGLSYVYFMTESGNTSQVCERMSFNGTTLMSSRDRLADVIRKELKKQRTDELKITNN